MIITESFVWLNNPKTASTFVRESLKQLYNPSWNCIGKRRRLKNKFMHEVLVPELRPNTGDRFKKQTPHGTVAQIPFEYSHLPIVSSFRNPRAKTVSLYLYGDWRKADQLPVSVEQIKGLFANFPELSFSQFILYLNTYYGRSKLNISDQNYLIGCLSADFLRFFTCCEGDKSNAIYYSSWGSLTSQLSKILFLRHERINRDLYDWLASHGHEHSDIKFILKKKPINISLDFHDQRQAYKFPREFDEAEWLLNALSIKEGQICSSQLVQMAEESLAKVPIDVTTTTNQSTR